MKIAHLISTYLPVIGGAQICIHNIAQRQAEGHQVVVIVPRQLKNIPTGNYQKEGLAAGTLFLLTAWYPLGRWYLIRQIQALQQKYNFDLWQVTIGYPVGVAVVDYFKKNKIPCVLRCSGEDIQIQKDVGYGVRLNKKADALVRANYKKFDGVVSISEAMTGEYIHAGVAKEKVVKIPNGVDASRFQAVRQEAKKEIPGIDKGQKIILTVGRNHPKKGFHLIPEIIEQLLKVRQDFTWLMVGDGNEEIKRQAEQKGPEVSGRIRVIPNAGLRSKGFEFPSRELIEIYCGADIFAFPTLIETFGIVVIEAMAAGLPVVTTTAPGVDELVENGVTGLKSLAGDVPHMAENIDLLLRDRDLYQRMANRAIQQSSSYDWDHIAESYLTFYQKVIRS